MFPVLTYEEWREKSFSVPIRHVDFDTFQSELRVERRCGVVSTVEEWNLSVRNPARKIGALDIEFWFHVMDRAGEQSLKQYFARRLHLTPTNIETVKNSFRGRKRVIVPKTKSLRNTVGFSRLVRQLHWDDMCDTVTSVSMTEVEFVKCIWERRHIPASWIAERRQREFDYVMGNVMLFVSKASIFPPPTLASILTHDLAPSTTLFCPVIGWSAYLFGFLLARHMKHFVGVDVNPKNVAVLRDLAFNHLRLPDTHVKIKQARTETLTVADLDLPPAGIGCVFFSPPYYDREKYHGPDQSHIVYKSYAGWLVGFYRPVIQLCRDVLTAPPRKMAIVVSDQNAGDNYYPLVTDTIVLANACGFLLREARRLALHSNRAALGIDKHASETLLIFEATE